MPLPNHQCDPKNAQKFWDWIHNRGGIAIWKSVNLSNPSASWSSPALDAETGDPTEKPTWQAESTPSRVITDPAEVTVTVPLEVKRFRVAIRQSSNGMSMKCTDGSSRKIRKTLDKINENRASHDDAWYEFDYSTQEAVFYVPDNQIPLADYINSLQEKADAKARSETQSNP